MGTQNDKDYVYGTPSTEDSNGLWKSAPSDPDVTNEEYDRAYEVMEDWLSRLGKVGYRKGCHFYFRGDNFGDRTQYLEIVDPSVLHIKVLLALQSLLREPRFAQWRIVIPTYLDKPSGIMVYPSAIVVGQPRHELSSTELSDIVKRMKEKDVRRASEEQPPSTLGIAE
ncbi:MAG TPA: hypothetical protein VJZ71_06850 [Phycisphaerae bacterium]|nr:hypothetical protein [Phycisphaerae bacterium]